MDKIKFTKGDREKGSWLIDSVSWDIYILECPECWIVNDYKKECIKCDFNPNE